MKSIQVYIAEYDITLTCFGCGETVTMHLALGVVPSCITLKCKCDEKRNDESQNLIDAITNLLAPKDLKIAYMYKMHKDIENAY